MIHERAALSHALLTSPVALYPKRILWSYFPPRDRSFDAETLTFLNRKQEELARAKKDADPAGAAFLSVLLADARVVERSLKEFTPIASRFEPLALVEEYVDYAEKYLKLGLGLPWHKLPMRIHERYPAPMQWQDTYAFTALQPVTAEIEPGIHYRRDHLFPALVKIATLHENVHVATPGPGTYLPFDNGIADFLAFVIHCHATGDTDAILRYRQYLAEVSPTLTEYPKHSQAIAALVLQSGMEGLFRIIRRRMQQPETIDWNSLYSAVRTASPNLQAMLGATPSRLPSLIDELEPVGRRIAALLVYPEKTIVISPAAFLFLNALRTAGDGTIDDLAQRFRFTSGQARHVRDELVDWRLVHSAGGRKDHLLYARPTDKLVPSNAPDMLGSSAIRVAPTALDSEVATVALDAHLYATASLGRGPVSSVGS